jgi:PAS domain S-box-containing protein
MKVARKSKGVRTSEKPIAGTGGSISASAFNGRTAQSRPKKLSDIHFANIVEKINEGFVALDAQMNYTYINQQGSELLRRKPEDLIGKNYWDEYPEDMDTSFGKAYLRALETQLPIQLEDYQATRNRWLENRIYPSEDGLSIFFRDITERKLAEEQLSRTASFNKAVMSNMGEGLYTVDSAGLVTSLNAAAEKLFGWTFDDLRGRKMHDMTHYKHLDGTPFPAEDCAGFQVLHHGKMLANYEDVFIRKDGTFFNVVYSSSPLWENGTINGLVVVFRDITERRQAEDRLVLLAEISELMRKFEDPNELTYAISKAVGEHLKVRRCLFNETDVENDLEIVHRDYYNGVESVAGEHKLSDYSSVTSAEMAAGKTVVNYDSKIDVRTAQDYERTYGPNGERAYIAVPFMRENRWVGTLWVSDDVPRQWSKDEMSLLETVAERTWTTIEKMRINSALRASEALYRTIARSIPGGGVYVVDKGFRYLIADGPVTDAFGLSREMLESHTVSEVFPQEQSARMEERLRRNFAGETLNYETNHNGRVYWTQQAPLLDSIGHAIIVTIDVTERKQAEEALRESEERFHAILRQATAGIVRKDAEGRLIFVNQAFCNMLGYTESELLGKTIWDLTHPDDVEENKRLYDRTMMEGIPFKLEKRLIREDGSILWVDVSVSPVIDATGKPHSAVAVEVDITGRKQAEEAVSASKERYRNLFDLVPVAVYACDAKGLIQEFNQQAVELWGREPKKNDPSERFCGSFKMFYPDGRFMPHKECPMARLLRGETLKPHELEILIERPDGTRRNIIPHPLALKNERGEIVGAINCVYDITARKQAEEALQQLNLQLENSVLSRTAKLREVNQTLRDEIAERKKAEEALHESRKRLQVLSQRLVHIQEEERRAIARELHDRVGQSLSALNINLVILNNQMSDHATQPIRTRMSDSMQLAAETITLVRDVMADLRPSVLDDYGLEAALQSHIDSFRSRYNIKVQFEKPVRPIPRLGSSVEMTFLRIAQEALINIARHAEAEQATLSLQPDEKTVRLIVQDDGIGINSWQEANRPGSHGLTIMRERAEAFRGDLKVTSIPGKGTKVEVSIPIERDGQDNIQTGRGE